MSKIFKSDNGAVTRKTAQVFINKAKKLFQDEGTIEVDHEVGNPLDQVSTAETVSELQDNGGLYVKAWVWVPLEALDEDEQAKVLQKIGD